MADRFHPTPILPLRGFRLALGVCGLGLLASCLGTRVEDDTPSTTPLRHYAHFRHDEPFSLPDSLWFESPLDSGAVACSWSSGTRQVVFFPEIHPLGIDSLRVETWRLGLRTGSHHLKEVVYGELAGTSVRNTAADSTARRLLFLFDSLRASKSDRTPADSGTGLREALRRTVAKLVFEGHPATTNLRQAPPVGLDTSDLVRRTLELALASDLSLAEITKRWTIGLDYAKARVALAGKGFDSLPLNPFRVVAPLQLDTLHLGEPGVGLYGRIHARKGIQSLSFTMTGDSGDHTGRFLVSDTPILPLSSGVLDLSGHPVFAPRSTATTGRYTLKLSATDSFGNHTDFQTSVWVGGPLDRLGPVLEVLDSATVVVKSFSDSHLVVRVKATDPSGVAKVEIGGVQADRGDGGIWSRQILVEVARDGRKVVIEAIDSAGNSRTTGILVRREEPPVPTPPRLHPVRPAPGTMLPFDSTHARVVWNAATGFGTIEQVTIGGLVATNTGDSTWEARLEMPPNGALADIVVRARSSLGLVSTELVALGRKADSAGPVVRWVSPSSPHRVAYEVDSLQVAVVATDLSGVDSVWIGGRKADSTSGIWLARTALALPGETTRILVRARDKRGNLTDSVLKVSRDPVPNGLPPRHRWIHPAENSHTVVPFDSTGIWIRCMLKDISGMDASSVRIGGVVATALDDSTWTARVELPPTGKETLVTLEAKNLRGVSTSSFVVVTRSRDTIPPTCTRIPVASVVVPFDTRSLEAGWKAKDNDRIDKAWIRGQLVEPSPQGYATRLSLAVGRQWIQFRAQDPAGNQVEDSFQLERRPDTIPPQITRGNGAVSRTVPFDTTSIELGWQASDNDRVAYAWIQDLSANPSSGGFVSRVPLAVGKQWVRILVEDATGNHHRDSVEIHRLADTARPKVAAMAQNQPRAVPWGTSSILAGWTATDNDRVAKAWIQDVPVDPTPEGFSRLVPLDTGLQWIRFRAQDPTGNEARDSFRVERLPLDTAGPVVASDTASRLRGGSFLVELTTTTPGSRIHYTLDGSDPTESSPRYGHEPKSNHDGQWGIWVDTTCTLKARAFAPDFRPGRILTQTYRLALPVAVASSVNHTLFLLSDGSLWAAGWNERNAFLPGPASMYLSPVKIADSVEQMSAGSNFSVWVKKDGSLWGIGANDSGNLGLGTVGDQSAPVLIRRDVARVHAFQWRRILVLDKSGVLWGAGTNAFGQLGTGRIGFEPSLVRIASDVEQFGGGDAHSYFLKKDGTLWAMGAPWNSRLGFWSDTMALVPTFSMDSVQWLAEKVGNTSFVKTRDGSLIGFGENAFGAMGTGDTQSIVLPRRLVELEAKGNLTAIAGHFHTLALTASGEAWATGYNEYLQASPSSSDLLVKSPQPILTDVQSIAVGPHHSFAITKSGSLYAWGNNEMGQLGVGSHSTKSGLTRVKF